MKYVICKSGETREDQTTVTLNRGESTIIIKDVSAQICENCGEYYLSEDVSAQVMAMTENVVKQSAEIEILRFAA